MTSLVLLGTTATTPACGPSITEGSASLVIENATVIDGTGSAPRANTTVVVVNGRIDAIAPTGSVRIDANVPRVDASGQWMVPGFIDTHAHLPGPADLEATLTALLAHGITAARSTATPTAYAVDIRDRLDAGTLAGPTFRVAGALLDGPGSPWGFAAVVRDAGEARAEVRAQARAGVDFIKLYTLLPPATVAAAIEEAHEMGLPVIGHLGRTTWTEALDLGIDALTHSAFAGMASSMVAEADRPTFGDFFIPNAGFDPRQFATWTAAVDDDVVRMLGRRIAERRVVLDPNLVLIDAMVRGDDPAVYEALLPGPDRPPFAPHPYSASWSPGDRAAARVALPAFFRAIRVLQQEGALITVGTDLGNPWMTAGVAFHRELELLVQAGLSSHEALIAATRNGAVALGEIGELGTLEVGKRADLILLGADPLEDILNTRTIVAVYQEGRAVAGRQE